MKKLITPELLKPYIDAKLNILISGKHGCGKTEVIKQVLTEKYGAQGEGWLYFSTSVMDPHLQLIGIPRRDERENGEAFLDYVLPENLQKGDIRCLVLDELNRAPNEVINALMELIQFKSINGKKYGNIEHVIAMVNPSEEDGDNDSSYYAVNVLDPAHLDRFHIQLQAEYDVSLDYFEAKHGSAGRAAVKYWRGLDSALRDKCSPRRLDYAVQIYKKGLDIAGVVIPDECNPPLLVKSLQGTILEDQLLDMLNNKTTTQEELSKFLNDDTTFNVVKELIVKRPAKTVPALTEERIASLVRSYQSIEKWCEKNKDRFTNVKAVIGSFDKARSGAERRFYSDTDLSSFTFSDKYKEHFGTTKEFTPSDSQKKRGLGVIEAFDEFLQAKRKELGITMIIEDVNPEDVDI